ncbi:MAG: tRNA (adenosine(37)-N6)-threonylcarbamoyltransferase complex dimerization subunit type 1 TsaB [Planctomycetota bacterium]
MPPVALALCASGSTFSVAARHPCGRVDELVVPGRRQVTDLPSLLDRLLDTAGASPADVAEIRIDRGPGSYTGLRVALTFARVLAGLDAVPLRTCTSLELMALAAWRNGACPPDRALRPILDARRGRAYTGRVERHGGVVCLAGAPVAAPVGDLPALHGHDETALLDPDRRAWLPAQTPVLAPLPYSARDLFDAALPGEATSAETLEPLYLMGSYAE